MIENSKQSDHHKSSNSSAPPIDLNSLQVKAPNQLNNSNLSIESLRKMDAHMLLAYEEGTLPADLHCIIQVGAPLSAKERHELVHAGAKIMVEIGTILTIQLSQEKLKPALELSFLKEISCGSPLFPEKP